MSALSSIGSSSPTSSNTSGGSSLIGLNNSGVSFQGLASGLNTDQIVQAMLAPQQQEITSLQNQQSGITQRETLYSTIQADLTALQSAVNALYGTTNNVFDGLTANSSASSIATASASNGAAPGNYTFTVNSLAQAQENASQGFTSASSTITQGTLGIQVGNGAVNTITIDSSNDTLQGLANAINKANAGVTASIINNGNSAGYQLLLTANNTGTANAFTITNNLAASGGGAIQPTFTDTVQAASDASISIGSGSGALTVTSSTNQIENAFQGVTLNLVSANPSQPVTISVANNTQAQSTAINNFVRAYNTVIGFINQNDTYDAQTKQGGPLLGDFAATSLLNSLGQKVTTAVPGVNSLANNLSEVGITVNADGTLAVNSDTLNQALSGKLSGVSASDIRNLFGQSGTSTNPSIQFVYAPIAFHTSQPVGVQITQAAIQGSITGSNTLPSSTNIQTGTNDTLTLTVNGKTSGNITLAAGSYSPQQLVQAVQSAINADSALSGTPVTASLNANNDLVLTSNNFGSGSSVVVGSGDALSSLGLTSGQSGTGTDVAGSFVVNGKSESATGSGQTLTGDSTNATTAGLVVTSTLTPSQITGTPEGSVTISQGIASQLGNALNSMLDPVTGQLTALQQSLQTQYTSIGQNITQLQQSMQLQQSQLLEEFVQMESNLASIQAAGSALGASLTGFSSSSSGSSGSSSGGAMLG
jgi:flagellar hook-associated protein 2